MNGFEVSGGNPITVDGTNYYFKDSQVTLSAKTGYTVDSSITIDSDKTITATLDTTNHYVFGNTIDYPDLIKVYSLTLPEGVTADGTYRSCQAG